MKIILLALLIMLSLDGIFRDGELLNLFLSHDFHLPLIAKIVYLIIAVGASLMLLHSIIWDYNILPKQGPKKTEYEIEKEMKTAGEKIVADRLEKERLEKEEQERLEREEKERLEKIAKEKEEKEKAKHTIMGAVHKPE
jgi:hypothetical protein